MSGNSKVVHLTQVRSHESGIAQPRLPLPLIKLRDEMAEQIRQLLRPTFENADDALFELAERADSNQNQSKFFDAMRELRLQRQRLELSFMQGYSQAFKDLASAPETSRPQTQEISLDSLSLVQNDELEERVAVESMVSKAKNRFSMELEHLTIRIESLLTNRRLTDDQNPLGPQVLSQAFAAACGELEMDIEAKLVVLKLFDKHVLANLQPVYEKANTVLAEMGVMPDLKSLRPTRKAYSNPSPAKQAATSSVTIDGQTGQPVMDARSAEVFGLLRELMAGHRTGEGVSQAGAGAAGFGGAGVSQANLPVMSQGDLMSLLSVAQHQLEVPGGILPGAGGNGLIDVNILLQALMQGDLQPARLNQVDEDVINLVSMLFEFILSDHQLPATMKALIARLQIPMLKVAILDKSFFGKGGHPARRLLNEIANAAMGWNEKPEGEPDPLRDKVEAIVFRLINEFNDNLAIFDEILADFQNFVQVEQRRRQLVEQRLRDAEEGKAKAELARREVQQALDGLMAGRDLPEVALKFLREPWSNVLVLLHLKHGAASDEWQRAMRLAQDLAWSVTPPEAPESRRQLLQMIPTLVKGLREGLATTSFNPFEMDKLFKELEACHLSVLRRLSAKPANAPAEQAPEAPAAPQALAQPSVTEPQALAQPPVEAPAAPVADVPVQVAEEPVARVEEPAVQAVEATAPVVAELAPQAKAAEPAPVVAAVSEAPVAAALSESQPVALGADDQLYLQQVDSLKVGSWVEFHEDEDKKFRAKLAAIIRATGKYIFVNRTGVKVAEKNREGLAMELREGRISLLDDGLLFDRALEAVIGNLRNNRRT